MILVFVIKPLRRFIGALFLDYDLNQRDSFFFDFGRPYQNAIKYSI